ncbi:thermostable hemolysin [Kaarinaea lacus]
MKLSENVGFSDHEANKALLLKLYDADTGSRKQVENFIHHVFARAYNADLNHYLPRLMALHGKDNRVIAGLGMQHASTGRLFLETYLQHPVEDVISQLSGTRVSRNCIMEVGNLASVHRGGLRQLIVALTSYLSGAGIEWVVFTAVPAVRNAFAALDLNLHPVAAADKSCLDQLEQASWGSYYETGPVVVAGRVEEGYRRLRELIELEQVMSMSCYLWQYAFAVGCQQRIINSVSNTQLQGKL